MTIRAHGICDPGKVRSNNEDAILIDEAMGLYLVSDGMGGHASGEVASSTTSAVVQQYVRENSATVRELLTQPNGRLEVVKLLTRAIQAACRDVYQRAAEKIELKGMGATVTLVYIVDRRGFMAHVGDSRLYLHRSGSVYQLSNDHTMAKDLVRDGLLSEEEAAQHGSANILVRAVGQNETVEVDTLHFDVLPGDTFLLCSDGLSGYFKDPTALVPFLNHSDLQTIATRLVETANHLGGEDNVSVVVIRAAEPSSTPQFDSDATAQQQRALQSVLFAGLEWTEFRPVTRFAETRIVHTDELLVDLKQELRSLFVVLEGKVEFVGSAIVRELKPGDTFGMEALLGSSLSGGRLHAVTPSVVLVVPVKKLNQWLEDSPSVGARVLRNLATSLWHRLQSKPGPQ